MNTALTDFTWKQTYIKVSFPVLSMCIFPFRYHFGPFCPFRCLFGLFRCLFGAFCFFWSFYRVLQFQQPSYLASLIPRYVPARALRSSSLSICVPPCKTTMAAFKSFSSVASGICNALPNHLSSVPTLPVFRRALKHHLFLLAYPDSSAKSGMIKPAQCISLCDTVPTTAIAQPINTMPPI